MRSGASNSLSREATHMPDETSLQETGAIPLREVLRRVIRRRGDVGRRAAERWCRVSFRELTRDEDDILHIGARMLFEWLQQGKLKALHRSDKQNLAKKIPRSVWVRCKLDEIHWHLSAIRAQPQACMIENIEVSALDVERLISQPAVETEKLHPSKFS